MATAVNNNNTTAANEMDEEQLLDYEEEQDETMETGAKGADGVTNGDAAKKAKVRVAWVF